MERRDQIDYETGEITGEPDKPKFKGKTEAFTKKKTEVWRHVYKANLFTAAEERVLHRLADYLQLNTNALVNPNKSPMTVQDMADRIQMNRSDLTRYLRQLVRKNALGIWKSGYDQTYYMNPYLYERGTISPWLFARFNEEMFTKQQKEQCQHIFVVNGRGTSLMHVQ